MDALVDGGVMKRIDLAINDHTGNFGYSRACGKMQETGIYRKVQKL